MTDVFVSYASEDHRRVQKLADALSTRGWSVWWDRNIITGQAYDQAIEHQLETAKCVVVLWSEHSIESEWVKNEAAAALERGVLVPAMIDRIKLPLEFRRKQTADLTDWKGKTSHRSFQALCEGIAAAISNSAPQETVPHQRQKPPRRGRWWYSLATVALVAAVGVYSTTLRRTDTPEKLAYASENKSPSNTIARGPELSDLAAGTYIGDAMGAVGGSRSDIVVAVTKIDKFTVRLTGDHPVVQPIEVKLTRGSNAIISNGDTAFFLDLSRNPPTLNFTPPDAPYSYFGVKQQ